MHSMHTTRVASMHIMHTSLYPYILWILRAHRVLSMPSSSSAHIKKHWRTKTLEDRYDTLLRLGLGVTNATANAHNFNFNSRSIFILPLWENTRVSRALLIQTEKDITWSILVKNDLDSVCYPFTITSSRIKYACILSIIYYDNINTTYYEYARCIIDKYNTREYIL